MFLLTSKHNGGHEPSSSCVYMFSRTNNKDLEIVFTTKNTIQYLLCKLWEKEIKHNLERIILQPLLWVFTHFYLFVVCFSGFLTYA